MERGELRLVIGLAVTLTVAFGSILYGFSVFVTDEAAGGEFSSSVLSLGLSGAAVVNGLSAPVIGRFMDRRGVRPVVITGSLLAFAGMGGFGAAQESWQVVAAWWLLIGPATAMVYYEPATFAIAHWIPATRRARAFGILTVIGGLAGAVFIPLTERLVAWLGWRPTAVALGALIAVTGLLAAWRLPGGLAPHADPPRARVPLQRMLSDRRFVLLTTALILTFGGVSGVLAHRVDRFAEAGFTVAVAAAWAGAASLISLPGRYLGPWLTERLRAVGVLAFVIVMLSVSVVIAIPGEPTWSLTGHFVVFGIAFGALTPLRAVVMSSWYGGASFGQIAGTQWGFIQVLGAGGPVLLAVLREASGSWTLPLVVAAAGTTVGALLALGAGAPARPAPETA